MARVEPDDFVPSAVLSALEDGMSDTRSRGISSRHVLDTLEDAGFVLINMEYLLRVRSGIELNGREMNRMANQIKDLRDCVSELRMQMSEAGVPPKPMPDRTRRITLKRGYD